MIPMKQVVLLVLVCLAAGMCHAQERLSYADSVRLVTERAPDRVDKSTALYVLGPWTAEETHLLKDNVEVKRSMPYCKIYSGRENKTLDLLVRKHLETDGSNLVYQVEVLRPGMDKPVMKISGKVNELLRSQYPLKPGDVVSFVPVK